MDLSERSQDFRLTSSFFIAHSCLLNSCVNEILIFDIVVADVLDRAQATAANAQMQKMMMDQREAMMKAQQQAQQQGQQEGTQK